MLTTHQIKASNTSFADIIKNFIWFFTAIFIIVWAARGTNADFAALLSKEGRTQIIRLLSEMFPPDLSRAFLLSTFKPLLETLQISILGTLLGVIGAFPLSILAVRQSVIIDPLKEINQKFIWLIDLPYYGAVMIMNILRSVPELVWALIFIAAVGLGPFAGILALAIHEIGTLGKLYSELFESVDPQLLEVLRSSGAKKFNLFLYGMIPETFPQIVSITLYRWECITRTATILGFVGAGGIGQRIDISMRLFQYDKLLALIILSLFLVTIVNGISAVLRKRLVQP